MHLVVLLIAAVISACISTKSNIDLSGKKILIVIAPSNFRDEEFVEPYDIFESGGANITIASLTTTPAKGMFGKVVTPNITVKAAKGSNFDAVVFVGGQGFEENNMTNNPDLVRIVQEANAAGKLVTAICIAPKILASAGVLKGKRATVYMSGAEYLKSKGAIYTGQEIEVDGRIITANGPHAARIFGEKVAGMLK